MNYRKNMPTIRNNRLRRVGRTGNIVTMQTNVDNFKLKDLGKIAINTVLSPAKAVAGTATKLVGAKKANEQVQKWGYNNATDFSNEKVGKAAVKIQKGTDVLSKVGAGAGALVGGAALLGGGSAAAGAGKVGSAIGGIFKKKSVTPMISPIKPTVASTTTDSGLKQINGTPDEPWYGDLVSGSNGIGATSKNPVTGSGVVDKVISLSKKLTPDKIQKGQALLQKGTGYLTNAQKQFAKGQTDPSRLPKTKALKEAEQALLMPQNEMPLAAASPNMGGFDNKTIMLIAGILAVGLVIWALNK